MSNLIKVIITYSVSVDCHFAIFVLHSFAYFHLSNLRDKKIDKLTANMLVSQKSASITTALAFASIYSLFPVFIDLYKL